MPTPSRRCARAAVPSRAMRAGHALRAIASPTASGQRSTQLGACRACGAEAARARARIVAHRADPCSHLDELRRLDRAGPSACVAVIIVWPMPATRAASARAAAEVELREHVVEQQERRRASAAARPRRAAARERRAAARPVNRTAACPGRRSRSARRRGAGRARSCHARGRASRRASRVGGAGAAGRRSRAGAAGSPSSPARSAKPGLERLRGGQALAARRAQPSSAAIRSVQGSSDRGGVEAEVDAAQRGIALRERCSVVLRKRRRGQERAVPSARSKYARRAAGPPLTTASRSGVKTSVAHLAPQRLR